MSGRLGHINDARRLGHIPRNGIRHTEYAYGIADVLFWLDAEYGTNTSVDLAAISQWVPRVGNNIFTQATAGNQPRFNAANASYNNHSTIEFHDTARLLSTLFPIYFTEDSTLVFVANYDAITVSNTLLGSSGNTDNIGLGGSGAGYNGCYFEGGSGGVTFASGTTDNTTPKICVMKNGRETNEATVRVNNSVEFTGTVNYPVMINQIGKRQARTDTVLRGKVAEILLFSSRLSDSEESQLTISLQGKYGL